MALAERSLLSSAGVLMPLNRPKRMMSNPPRVRGDATEGTAATYWEWSKTNAPKFARPGRRPVPKGKARFMPGRDGTPLGRHITRHDINQQLATDDHARRLGFQVPSHRPSTADLAKEGSLFLPGQLTVQKRRSPSRRGRARTPDSGLTDYTLDYMVSEISFNGTRSEFLPPSAPFSFMAPSGPLERERMRPHSAASHDPTDGIYDLPRWPAFQLGGLELSGTYPPPERSRQEPTRPPSRERLESLAKAMRGPQGMHEIKAAKIEAQLAEELNAQSIHKDKKPPSKERLESFAKPLPHKQGAKYVKPVEVRWKPPKRKTRHQQASAMSPSTGVAEQRVLEVKTVDGMKLTQVVTKPVQQSGVSDEAKLPAASYPDRDMTAVGARLMLTFLAIATLQQRLTRILDG